MPSLHVGWALWCGFLIYRYASRTWVRALGVAYPIVTALVVLSTGNHYLFDAIAGALVMVIGGVLAVSFSRLHQRYVAHRATRPNRVARDADALAAHQAEAEAETGEPADPAASEARAKACLRR